MHTVSTWGRIAAARGGGTDRDHHPGHPAQGGRTPAATGTRGADGMSNTQARIVRQLRARIVGELGLGTLVPGDRIPGVRELAHEFGAHERTVARAVRTLGREGLLDVRPRSGAYVASDAHLVGWPPPRTEAWLVDVLAVALEHGVLATELPDRLRLCLDSVRLSVACVECNVDQRQWLCAELERAYGVETLPVDWADVAGGDIPADVGRADLVVTTAFHTDEVRRFAERAGKPWVAVLPCNAFDAEVSRQLARGPVRFVVADPHYAAKLRVMHGGRAGAANLLPLVVGRDDVTQIPAGAPVYVTRAARDRLGCEPALAARAADAEPAFSRQTAHALFAIILRTNVAALRARGLDPTAQSGV